jgi:hypothetical protein
MLLSNGFAFFITELNSEKLNVSPSLGTYTAYSAGDNPDLVPSL